MEQVGQDLKSKVWEIHILPKSKFNIVGIRRGEKLHEEMLTLGNSINTIGFKDKYVMISRTDMIDKYYTINKDKFIRLTKNFFFNSRHSKHFFKSEVKSHHKLCNRNLTKL